MIGTGPHNGFRVSPMSVVNIRKIAISLSSFLGIGSDLKNLNIARLLDMMSNYGITYDVLEPQEMPHSGVEGCCNPQTLEICIRQDVYEKACNNDPRARFTIMHEFGHLFLGHQRTAHRETTTTVLKNYEDSEWQANQFSAEFLMPLDVIQKLKLNNPYKIMMHFNASEAAAHLRYNQLTKRSEI